MSTPASGFWGARTIWRLAYRAVRGEGVGYPYFLAHPEFLPWLRLAQKVRYSK